ncbi:MAG TPA: carbohydrate binding domain-containing protein [Bacteroidales bacterium]|nr:carbohydrate binding domain-containing protein [Bacteroidales bacterium]
MRNLLLTFVIINALMTLNAQENLVYNGSFEAYCWCPEHFHIDTFACDGWWSPNDATPDYFHKCMDNGVNSYYYYKSHYEPKTGDGYIGLALIGEENFWMEHIQSKLIEPLEAGKQYKVSFWVKLAYKYSDYAAYNIGLYFSKDSDIVGKKYNVSSYVRYMTPELRAHIKNPDGNFIIDTNWVEISGIYTAQGGEQYVTIGMFWDDTPAVVEAYEKYKNKNTRHNKKLLSIAIKKNLLVENKYILEKYKRQYTIKAPDKLNTNKYKNNKNRNKNYELNFYFPEDTYFKHEPQIPYYLIDDVSVIELNE